MRSSPDPLPAHVALDAEYPAAPGQQGETHALFPHTAMRVVDLLAECLVVAALLGELALVLANVVARAFLHHFLGG